MPWALVSAASVCARRRLRAGLRRNPVLAAAAVAALAAAPAVAAWSGDRLARPFARLAAGGVFVDALALGVAAPAAVAGASVALLAPHSGAIGEQLEAAPLRRAWLALATAVLPACALGAVVAAPILVFTVTLAGAAGPALALAGAASASLGAALGATVRLSRARWAGAAATAACAAGAWVAAGGVRGPASLARGALDGSPIQAAAAAAAVTLLGLVLWTLAAAGERARSPGVGAARFRRLPGTAVLAVAVVTSRRVARHRELRLHGVFALVAALVVGAALARGTGVGGAPAVGLCVALVLTAVLVYPPAAVGFARAADWLFETSPRRRSGIAAAAAAGGVATAAVAAAGAALGAVPFARAGVGEYLELAGAAAFVLGCASLAAAFVPWRPDRMSQQLAAYAAALIATGAGWFAAGRLGAFLDAGTGTAFTLAAGALALVAGIAAAAIAR